jgi:hypothetical protein
MTIQNLTDMISAMKTTIATYERAAESLQGVLLGQGFIVRCQGLCLTFDIEAGHAINPTTSQPQRAVRFTREDAQRIASVVKNGNGIAGEAVHVRQAIMDELTNERDLLALLEAKDTEPSI